jgi:hypothetical protein
MLAAEQIMQILLASDFSGLAHYYLFTWAMIAVGCLTAGLIVASVLAAVTKNRAYWFTGPLFGAIAFAVGWLVRSLGW